MQDTLRRSFADTAPGWPLSPASGGGVPRPDNDPSPPPPGWTPDVKEPEPDLLPDETPVPNPDENRDPPMHAGTTPKPYPGPTPEPDPQPTPPPGPHPSPNPAPI